MGIMKADTPTPDNWLAAITEISSDDELFRGAAKIGALGAIVYQAAFDQSSDPTVAAIVLATWLANITNSAQAKNKEPE